MYVWFHPLWFVWIGISERKFTDGNNKEPDLDQGGFIKVVTILLALLSCVPSFQHLQFIWWVCWALVMENLKPQEAGWGHLKCGCLSQHSIKTLPQKSTAGTFLGVHWLRLWLAVWGDAGLIPVGELRCHMPRSKGFHVQQLLSWSATTRVCALQGKISRDTTKTWQSK